MRMRRIRVPIRAGRALRAAAVGIAAGLAGLPVPAQGPAEPPPEPLALDVADAPLAPLPLPERTLETSSDIATRTSRLLSRVPASVTVLSGERVRDLGGRFLSDALRSVPGLEVLRLSATESSVCARGFADDNSASQGILGMVDGRSVYNELLGSVLWDTLPLAAADVDRIETVRGPGSFVHGPNAMHGMVGVSTRSPLDYAADTVRLSAAAGTYDSRQASVTAVRRFAESGFQVRAAWDDLDEFQPAEEDAKNKVFGELRYATLLDGRSDARLDMAAGISRQQADILIPTFAGLPPATLQNDMGETYARARLDLGDFRGRLSWTHFTTEDRPDQIYAPFSARMDTVDLDLQHSVEPWKGNTLTGGAGYHFAGFLTEDQDVTGGRHQIGIASVFLQDEAELVDEALWLTAGARFDWHTVSGGHVCPRAALVWKPDPGAEHYLRASAGCGYRNPSLRELWFDMPLTVPGLPVQPRVVGNRDLDPEQMRSFEAGYTGHWGDSPARTSVEAVVYYNRVDDVVEFRPVAGAPVPTYRPVNVNDNIVYGGELEMRQALGEGIEAFANYAYTIRIDRETRERIPLAPRHTANVGVRADAGAGVALTLWMTFFDDTKGYDPAGAGVLDTSTNAYALLNARAAWTFLDAETHATAFLEAFNLLDHDHREHPEGDAYGLLLSGGVEVRW